MPVRRTLLAAPFPAVCLGWCAVRIGAAAQERRVPASPNELRLSYAPVVQRVAPAVVNVYAAKTVVEPQSAVRRPVLPALLRRAGRPGGPREQMQRSLGSGVIVDAIGPGGHQQPRHRGRRPGEGLARRQARIRGRDRAEGCAHRSRRAAHQGRQGELPGARIRQFRRAAGGRRRARDRQSRSASARP